MRLGRCLRKERRFPETLEAYASLADLGDILVAGLPANLVAHRERMSLFQALGDSTGQERESTLLAAALRSGSLRIDRAGYEFFRECLPGKDASPEEAHQLALAEAVGSAWSRWRESPDQTPARLFLPVDGRALVVLIYKAPAGLAVMAADCNDFMASLQADLPETHVPLQLIDTQGQAIWGTRQSDKFPLVLRASLDTGLPWSVRISSENSTEERSAFLFRRKLLIGAMAMIMVVLTADGYAICRAVLHEMHVARLQSDFVAAVSHEFRTPLAAICHLTESLEEDRVEDQRRPAYYRALAKESCRLREMVENLLDFARMESGRQVYRQEEISMQELVGEVVESFRERSGPHDRQIDLVLPDTEIRIYGDTEALSRAVRNLLDNAAKYSPPSSPIRVVISTEDGRVMIRVEDQGIGIAQAEQGRIFGKFVRGSSAGSLNVKGTGIGLAMVRHIVEGHRGKISAASEPGKGSCFTIELPLKQI